MRSASAGAGRILGLLSLFLVVSVVAGALVAGLFVPTVAAAGGATRGGINWFNDLKSETPNTQLQQQSKLLTSDGTLIARFNDENRSSVPLSKIAPVMQNAIIAIEDSRFRDHGGVDPVGLLRAFVSNEFGGGTEVQGASTLTQQYIKNLCVEQATGKNDRAAALRCVARDPSRKVLEIRAAIDLEKTLSKDEILTRYLNIAYFGNGAYGIQAAAERYFSRSAAKLTLPQAALLAGMVQSPSVYDPLSKSRQRRKEALARRNTVLDRMHELGLATTKAWKAAKAPSFGVKPRTPQSGCITATNDLGYFCQYVRNVIAQGAGPFAALGTTKTDRLNALNRGGLKIYTTIDLPTQKAATAAIDHYVPIGDKSKAASAAVTVEPGTGKVLAMAQNKTYSFKQGRSTTEINYSVDTDLGGSSGMQTGSTFKAFTLAAYLKDGNHLNDVVDGSITERPFSEFTQCGGQPLRGGTYPFQNSEKDEKKKLSVMEATANSVNTAYVAMETKVPLCDIVKTAGSIGVHQAAPTPDPCVLRKEAKLKTELPDCLPSLTLGPLSIAPLTMAEAYGTFAADGTYCPAWPISKIVGQDGKEVALKRPNCDDQALPQDVAHGVTYALKGVLTHGTAAGVWNGPTSNVAGKTGTTDASKDTWFVGYTRERATAVWVGDSVEPREHPNGKRRSLNGRTIGGHSYGNVFGATIAAPIWNRIMKTAINGTDTGSWDNPPADMIGRAPVVKPDPKKSGQGAGDGTVVILPTDTTTKPGRKGRGKGKRP